MGSLDIAAVRRSSQYVGQRLRPDRRVAGVKQPFDGFRLQAVPPTRRVITTPLR